MKMPKFLSDSYWKINYFSPERIIRRVVRNVSGIETLCDIGCGDGELVARLRLTDKIRLKVGLDIYSPSLICAQGRNLYDFLILGDISRLPIKNKRFDLVLASQVVEHLPDRNTLEYLEQLCRKILIVTTPRGYSRFSPKEEHEDNVHQRHLTGYEIEDFRKAGFKVYGMGMRIFCNRWYKDGRIPAALRPLFSFLSLTSSFFTYFFPVFSDCLICIKTIDTYSATQN